MADPKAVPLESSIVRSIMTYLEKLPNSKFEKTHGGRFGKAGKPDITGCHKGRRVEIEVKRPGEKPTDLQWKEMREWAKAGALVCWVTSVEQVRGLFEGTHGILDDTPNNGKLALSVARSDGQ